jgi:hypothetical protein
MSSLYTFHILNLSNDADVTECVYRLSAVCQVFSEIKVLYFYVSLWQSVPRAIENCPSLRVFRF